MPNAHKVLAVAADDLMPKIKRLLISTVIEPDLISCTEMDFITLCWGGEFLLCNFSLFILTQLCGNVYVR